jgi:hypothetical protein
MGNRGLLRLELVDVTGRPIDDVVTARVLRNDGLQIGNVFTQNFTRQNHVLDLSVPAFPQAQNLRCQISAKKYRHAQTSFFTLKDGETKTHRQTLVRDPERFTAQFVRWDDLSAEFDLLRRVLAASPDVELAGSFRARFTSADYDAVMGDDASALAKCALLNLYAKMTRTPDPIGRRPNWFAYVERILAIRRERVVARVSREAFETLQRVLEQGADFPQYKVAGTGEHRKNIPSACRIVKIKSVKTREDAGNLQLTIASVVIPGDDAESFVLDADLDENGRLLPHLFDVLLKHPVTGGTHPFDIHEILAAQSFQKGESLEFGYELLERRD